MSELPTDQLLTVAQAIGILDSVAVVPGIERLPLSEALGRRLAVDISADGDHPPFDKSQMDGYAVRSADGDRLRIVGEIMAGTTGAAIQPGEAMAIMTGAPVPAGADAIVPVEQTSREGGYVTLRKMPMAGQSIARRGSDCAAGRLALKKGTVLGAAQIAVAASVGASQVDLFSQPKVAVLCTGDELVEIDQIPTGAQIRNANGPMLVALLTQLGCDVNALGTVRDEPAVLRAALEQGMAYDALFVTGGMSMGERDYVPRLLKEIGLELKISKVSMKPGKPFVFASDGSRRVFGLPGNPVSALVCTLRFAARLLARMSGGPPAETWPATLIAPLAANGPREFYQPAIVERGQVTPLSWQGSADIFTLAAANCLIVRPAGDSPRQRCEIVQVLSIPQ